MRVISGDLKGKKLKAPAGHKVRPTSDRIKEAMFNILNIDKTMKVLDLFAGSGNLGIEALSRGALTVTFIEKSTFSFNILKENVNNCNLNRRSVLIRGDVYKYLKNSNKENKKFDLILADPPYELGHVTKLLTNEYLPGIVSMNGIFVLEHSKSELPDLIEAEKDLNKVKWQTISNKKYGKVYLTFFENRDRSEPT